MRLDRHQAENVYRQARSAAVSFLGLLDFR
jgi:hypothetical protein